MLSKLLLDSHRNATFRKKITLAPKSLGSRHKDVTQQMVAMGFGNVWQAAGQQECARPHCSEGRLGGATNSTSNSLVTEHSSFPPVCSQVFVIAGIVHRSSAEQFSFGIPRAYLTQRHPDQVYCSLQLAQRKKNRREVWETWET